ncbi:unnamed protein product [Mesocestoides corti]|uniref:Uncharacterized protein n=1 Tax=Mesocestoides corti TaxID=53468 RepID=A0A3P6HZT3_MESCO|nr:unnamed protein product [Mesocestoides corti]
MDREDSCVGVATVDSVSSLHASRAASVDTDAIRRLLRPVREKHSSKEAEEVRITRLHRHALQISSDVESSLDAIPLLESIVHSFVLKSVPIPSHLLAIKFASCKLLANLYLKSENFEASLKLLKLAVELDSTDLSIWLKLASTAIRLCRICLATTALLHILDVQPCHPLALHLGLPYFLAISEFESTSMCSTFFLLHLVCLDLSVKTLLLDPYNEPAIYCIQRILVLQPNLDPLIEKVRGRRPDILSIELPEASRKQIEERVETIREGYLSHLRKMGEREVIKTVKFPDPLSKLSWEHLSRAVVSMFDKLSSENATNSMLDLGSLFDGGQIPAKQLPGEPKSPNRVPANDAPGACPPPLPSDANAKTPEPLAQQPDRVRSETAELPQRCVGDKGEDDDRPRSSKRTRRSALMVDDSPQGTQTGSTGNIGLATANASLPSSTPATGLQANPALQQHTRQQWISKANLFRGLLPACFRDLALLEEKARIHASAEKSAKKPARVSRLPVVTESNSDESPVPPSPVSECDMVTEFLRVLAEDKPNIVFLGIALLLQMSSLTKPWYIPCCLLIIEEPYLETQLLNGVLVTCGCMPFIPRTQSFSTAYLAVAARVRPCLPTWDPDTLPKGKVPRQPVGDTLLPAELLRLSALPNFELLVNLHTAYAEVRLDALATCQRASSQSLTPPRDVELEALRNALKSDTARFVA